MLRLDEILKASNDSSSRHHSHFDPHIPLD